jgi:cobalt/nickel transport system permease protein
MHIPDGFIDPQTSAAFGVAAAAGVAFSIRGAREQLETKTAPLAGLTAVFIFAVQMLNFPVAAGTSGHLLGSALAVVLVGPHAAVLSLSVVLIIQAFLFADGGLSALGLNIFNISILGVWFSYGAFVLVRTLLPKTKSSVVVASGVAAFLSVPVAATGFVVQYWLGGTATFSVSAVFTAMFSTHVLIGFGEAVITVLTVSSVLSSRSDLVFGWRGKSDLELRTVSA